MAMLTGLLFLFPISEIILQALINYPPTLEQLKIGIGSPLSLWTVRLVGLVLTIVSVLLVGSRFEKKTRHLAAVILLASPTLSFLWMSFPLDVLKIFLVAAVYYLSGKLLKNGRNVFFITLGTILILNLFIFNQKPEFLRYLSPQVNQAEVTHRFTSEDNLKPHIEIPTGVRRLGYNKYYVSLKNIGNLSMSFFNLETLFFQEVHPMNQKATVMFFWPEIFIFAAGIWVLAKKEAQLNKEILFLAILAFFYFITEGTSIERRLVFLLFPISLLIANGILAYLSSKNRFVKGFISFVIFLSFYGWTTNLYDRYQRQGYWFDNRPISYRFVFETLKGKGIKGKTQVAETLYSAKEYCKFYYTDCDTISIENFDLSKKKAEPGTIYVGFLGNFLGPNPESNFPRDFKPLLEQRGLELLGTMRTADNIANTYGQDLVVAIGKQ